MHTCACVCVCMCVCACTYVCEYVCGLCVCVCGCTHTCVCVCVYLCVSATEKKKKSILKMCLFLTSFSGTVGRLFDSVYPAPNSA